jgi:hypothetical protein
MWAAIYSQLVCTGGCRPTFSEMKIATAVKKQSEKLCHLPCYHGSETELNRIKRKVAQAPFDIYALYTVQVQPRQNLLRAS